MLVEFDWPSEEEENGIATLIGDVISIDSGGLIVRVVGKISKRDYNVNRFLDRILNIDVSTTYVKEFYQNICVGDTVISTTDSSWLRKNKIYKVKSISDEKAVIGITDCECVHNIPLSYLRKVNL